jgi:hypothetical protein
MSQQEKVAAAAVAWNRARVFCERLREARSMYICEKAKEGNEHLRFSGQPDDWNETEAWRALADAPCWKNWHENAYGDDLELEPKWKWCRSCHTRTLIHQAYRAAVLRRGARMRVLQRFAFVAGRRPSPQEPKP